GRRQAVLRPRVLPAVTRTVSAARSPANVIHAYRPGWTVSQKPRRGEGTNGTIVLPGRVTDVQARPVRTTVPLVPRRDDRAWGASERRERATGAERGGAAPGERRRVGGERAPQASHRSGARRRSAERATALGGASERRERATGAERGGAAPSERRCGGVRGATPLG